MKFEGFPFVCAADSGRPRDQKAILCTFMDYREIANLLLLSGRSLYPEQLVVASFPRSGGGPAVPGSRLLGTHGMILSGFFWDNNWENKESGHCVRDCRKYVE
jgi:hypothetical protein